MHVHVYVVAAPMRQREHNHQRRFASPGTSCAIRNMMMFDVRLENYAQQDQNHQHHFFPQNEDHNAPRSQ